MIRPVAAIAHVGSRVVERPPGFPIRGSPGIARRLCQRLLAGRARGHAHAGAWRQTDLRNRLTGWLTTELTDACSGETFALADFAGKTLYVESMATWCGECYEQLTRVQDAAEPDPGG